MKTKKKIKYKSEQDAGGVSEEGHGRKERGRSMHGLLSCTAGSVATCTSQLSSGKHEMHPQSSP